MTTTIVGDAREPDGAPRIVSLDVMRGIAILGILFMNINSMGASRFASAGGGDVRWIGWAPLDQIAWWLRETLADGTARGMLQMLFGAGVVILTGRMVDKAGRRRVFGRFLWRNVVLFLFGLVHLFILLWPGDILHTYAVAAIIIYPLRRLSPRWLLILGMSFALFGLVYGGVQTINIKRDNALYAQAKIDQAAHRPLTAAKRHSIKETEDYHVHQREMRTRTDAELKQRRSGFYGWASMMWTGVIMQITPWGEPMHIWESAAAMLVGAALFKWGVLQGNRSGRFYLVLMLGAYAAGLLIRIDIALVTLPFDDEVPLFGPLREVGRLAMTIGHVGAIGLLLHAGRGRRLLAPFQAAGQTALSLYVCQTLICLWVLYPPFALGLFGTQGWAGLMLTGVAIDAALLLLANWWVRHFAIAPVEWAWRSIVARRRLPFRLLHANTVRLVPLTA